MDKIIQLVRGLLVAKVFGVCFLSIHLPLIGLACYLALGRPTDPLPVLLIALLATLLGSILAFLAIRFFLGPIDRIIHAMERYRLDGKAPALKIEGMDAVSRLAEVIVTLVQKREKIMLNLKRQANSDPLTGLRNRRWLKEAAHTLVQRAARLGQSVLVIVFDLDHFKRINDSYGHPAGDEVLVGVARIAQLQLRPVDLIARIGGEEFCIHITGDDAEMGIAAASRLRASIEAWMPSFLNEPVTASFGVHRGDPQRETYEDMFREADRQLYRAKAMGRNQVMFAAKNQEPNVAENDSAARD